MRIDLSGAPQTMLATLYAKALDADFQEPILGDRFAKQIVERIDYDWRKTTITASRAPSVTARTAHFDAWTSQFLAVHPQAVVLHVGCGLDSRFFRLQPGPGVEWYDVDYPEVAALRTQLYPAAEHYRVVAGSVTDPGWLADIPADRPALMVGEGLTMYLTEQDGIALLRRVVGHFGSGELQFDAFNWLGIKAQAQFGGAPLGIHLTVGDQRARRHRRGGARVAAAGLAAVVRVGHLRQAAALRQADERGDGAGFGGGQHVPIPPLRIWNDVTSPATGILRAAQCCSIYSHVRRRHHD